MNYSSITTMLLLASLQLQLSGCFSHNMNDLHEYTAEVLTRPGGPVESVPSLNIPEPVHYVSGKEGKRDPFLPFYVNTHKKSKKQKWDGLTQEQIAEVNVRLKEDLEDFELDSLRMVGTLNDENHLWGLILDPEGYVHQVRHGDYLGRNTGKILYILEDRVELRELIQYENEEWGERTASVALAEG